MKLKTRPKRPDKIVKRYSDKSSSCRKMKLKTRPKRPHKTVKQGLSLIWN